jgi:hypothetical protein
MADKKYIDANALPLYDELFMNGENHSGVWVRYRDVEKLIRNAPAADVVEIDAVEKALLDRCTVNSYGGLTKADVKRELAKFRRKDNATNE